jgi:long-subunit fatty acid transport protein
MQMKGIALVSVAAVVLLGVLAPTAYGGGWSVNDCGATRVGMYAVIGKVNDPTALFHNIANIATVRGTHLNISGLGGFASVKFKLLEEVDPVTGERYYSDVIKPKVNWGAFPFTGITFDAGLEKWRFGVSNYFPNLTGGILDENGPARYHIIKGYFATNYTTFAVARKITDQLYVGAGPDLIYALTVGNRKMNLYNITGLPGFKDYSDLRIFQQIDKFTYGWHASVLYIPDPKVRIGISYFDRVNINFDGDITMKTSNNEELFGFQQVDVPITLNQLIPRGLKMGMSFVVNEKWNWGLDLYWWDYSKFKQQKMVLDFDSVPGLGPILGTFMGNKTYIPKNYHDSWQVCAGAEYTVNEKWKVRFGMQYDDSPIPDESFSIDALTSDTTAFAFGFEYAIKPHSRFGLGYQHLMFAKRDIKNSLTDPPTNGKIIESATNSLMLEWNYQF